MKALSLFMRADDLIFGYFETEESLAVAQAKVAAKEVNTCWQEFMAPFINANARPMRLSLNWKSASTWIDAEAASPPPRIRPAWRER